jgi:hypothetical protein
MGATLAAVGTYFGSAGGAAMTAAAASDIGGGAIAAGVGTAGLSGAAGLTAAGAAAGTAGLMQAAGTSAATALATGLVTKALAPKPPQVPGVTPMPDLQAQQQAQSQSIAEQMARRGRASTILTAPSNGTLGS